MINYHIHNSIGGSFLPLYSYGSCGGNTSQGYLFIELTGGKEE